MAKATAKSAAKQKEAFKIEKREDGRYAVKKQGGGYINGPEKTKILQDKNLIKVLKKKEAPKTEVPAEA